MSDRVRHEAYCRQVPRALMPWLYEGVRWKGGACTCRYSMTGRRTRMLRRAQAKAERRASE